MKTLMIPLLMALVLVLAVGCSDTADATGPFFVDDLTLTTSFTFVAIQDSLASTTKKTAYVLALDDDLEVSAWRYSISSAAREWVKVEPSSAFGDTIMTCPMGYVLPVEGLFDALIIRGKSTGGNCQVQAYK